MSDTPSVPHVHPPIQGTEAWYQAHFPACLDLQRGRYLCSHLPPEDPTAAEMRALGHFVPEAA